MKSPMTLIELANELERQQNAKVDLVAGSQDLEVNYDEKGRAALHVAGGINETFGVSDYAHGQIASRLKIPRKHYDRLRESHPDLLEPVVNGLLTREPKQTMVRTLDGQARALLSDRYKRLDNYRLANQVLSVAAGMTELGDGLQVSAYSLTETKMTLRIVWGRVEGEVRQGDFVKSGFVLRNSEVGAGSVDLRPLLFRLVCTNGMVVPTDLGESFRRTHLGGKVSGGYAQDTIDAAEKAVMLEVRDLIRLTADPNEFAKIVGTMRESAERTIDGDIPGAVRVMAKRLDVRETESSGILGHLIREGDLTQWGLANAVTRYAQDVSNVDRSVELEEIGGRIIDLPRSSWNAIANVEPAAAE